MFTWFVFGQTAEWQSWGAITGLSESQVHFLPSTFHSHKLYIRGTTAQVKDGEDQKPAGYRGALVS